MSCVVAGLGSEGCDVQVKPGNASCKFSPVYKKRGENHQFVPSDGYGSVELRDIELRGADRTITVAITIREKGQTAKTFYRGFRLKAKPDEHDREKSSAATDLHVLLELSLQDREVRRVSRSQIKSALDRCSTVHRVKANRGRRGSR